MKNFSKSRDYSKGRRNDGERPRMHSAVCTACGKRCEVPFRPTGEKPIYCSSCFEKERGVSTSRGGRDNRRDNKETRKMFSATCVDCGVRCEVPFRPTGEKPIYCSSCFEAVDSNRSAGFKKASKPDGGLSKSDIALIGDQLISINSKLEKILLAIKPEEKKNVEKDEKPKDKKIITKNKKKVVPKKEVKKTAKPAKEKKKAVKKSFSKTKKKA
jgi:CxxC-x17-CxxC domain-containing protein